MANFDEATMTHLPGADLDLTGATVVFDLDGTLVDTAPDLLRALSVVMTHAGLLTPPAELMRRLVGQGARALIERAAALQNVTFEKERLDALTEMFIDVYRDDIASESAPFPSVEKALDVLASAGALLTVCTNKRTELSVRLLEAVGLLKRFGAVIGSDSVPERKPAPGHFIAAVEAVGGVLGRSVMVGDSAADVSAAKSASAPCVAVRFGYCDGDVEALGADIVIDSFEELPFAVRTLLPR
jgi:phosphoglycolate phosphatase